MKTRILTLIFLIGIILTSCLNRNPKIGFLIHGYDSPRWENDEKYFIEAVKQLKAEALVREAGNKKKTQLDQAQELIKLGVAVLVVIPVDQYAASKIVNLAHENGIKVIAYDRMINNCPLDYFVSADNVKIGELQASYISKVQQGGNYALLGGPPSDNNSRMIYVGQMNVLEPLVQIDEIKVVFEEFANAWSTDEGYRLAKKCLDSTANKIDAILCGNDQMAIGAIKALKEKGLAGKVAVAGQDADLPNIHEIIAGNQAVTIFKKIKTMAGTAAELAIHIAKDEKIENTHITIDNGQRLVPSYLVDAVTVDAKNIKMTVVAEGYQQEEEIFSK